MTSKLCQSRSSRERLGVPVLDRISDAVKKGDEDTFRQLISLFKLYEAANLNQLDSCGSHPLHWAVRYRRVRMLKTMLHYKKALRLNVDITDVEGVTVLEIAMKHRNHQVVHTLVKHGCNTLTATSFQQLRQQLLGGIHNPTEVLCRERESLSASCVSEMAAQCLPTPVDEITTTQERSNHHLWHPISGTHWSSEICEKAVQRCYVDLTKFIDPSLIIPLLVQSGHLHLSQLDVILSLQTKREQTLQLLALLHRSGRWAYHGLFKALKDETEHGAHQDLLKQLESTCDSLLTEGESTGLSQDALDDTITFYYGEDQRTQTPSHGFMRSLELSDRSESGIYSVSTPGGISVTHSGRRLNSATLSGTQSSGQLSTTSQRTSSFTKSQSARKRSSVEEPSVKVGGRINHRASRDFRAVDECHARPSVKVINAVVKREPAPVHAVIATKTNASGGVCVATGRLLPIQETETLSTSAKPNLDLSSSFGPLTFSVSGEHQEEDVEGDVVSSEVSKLSSPKPSAPIDIPLRNESYCSLPSVGSGVSEISARHQLSKQISADTPSSDSDSSDSSYIKLGNGTSPKYLPHNPSTERWWTKPFGVLFSRWKVLSPIPDSNGNNKSDSRSPKYLIGYGMRM